nr:MAG TPA: hypothetical protein [Caudoviricetes sp.]
MIYNISCRLVHHLLCIIFFFHLCSGELAKLPLLLTLHGATDEQMFEYCSRFESSVSVSLVPRLSFNWFSHFR